MGQDITDVVPMVACELSENAVKYGTIDTSQVEVAVTLGSHSIVVAVKKSTS